MTPHPLVLQLRFTRREFQRALEGVTDEEARKRFEPMNSFTGLFALKVGSSTPKSTSCAGLGGRPPRPPSTRCGRHGTRSPRRLIPGWIP